MKRFKKTLCLMLALVMTIGIVPFAATASFDGFTDAGAINQTTAATILTALDVIEGFPDGSFRPDSTLTRAQAAAIVTRLVLTRNTADRLPQVDTRFPDVRSGDWHSGYIGYCVSQGIIEGFPDGTFKPNNEVTGSQFAAMLLRSLGYGRRGEYVGVMWEINAITDGVNFGVLEDVPSNVNFSAPAKREEAAQYAFNLLLPTLDDDAFTSLQRVYWSEDVQNYRPAMINAGTIRDTVYRGILEVEFDQDDLGRPFDVWKLGDDHLADIYYKPIFESGEAITQGSLYTALGLSGGGNAFDIFENGVYKLDLQPVVRGNGDDDVGISNNGVITLVYSIDNDKTKFEEDIFIVQYNVYVAEVAEVEEETESDDRFIVLDAITGPYDDEEIETEDFDEEDIVLYTYTDAAGVIDIWLARVVSGVTVSATSGTVSLSEDNEGSFVSGGTRYYFNVFNASHSGLKAHADDTHDLFLDDYGFVVYIREAAVEDSDPEYIFVLTSFSGTRTVEADVVFADGTVDTIQISHFDGDAVDTSAPKAFEGNIYEYEIDGARYKLMPTTMHKGSDSTFKLTAGSARFSGTGSTATHFANSNTTYVVGDEDDGFTVFNGVRNSPGVENADRWAYVLDGNVVVIIFLDGGEIEGAVEGRDVVVLANGSRSGSDLDGAYIEYRAVIDGEIGWVKRSISAGAHQGVLFTGAYALTGVWQGSLRIDENGRYDRVQQEALPSNARVEGKVFEVTAEYEDGVIWLHDGVDDAPYTLESNIPVFRMRHSDNVATGNLSGNNKHVTEGSFVMVDWDDDAKDSDIVAIYIIEGP